MAKNKKRVQKINYSNSHQIFRIIKDKLYKNGLLVNTPCGLKECEPNLIKKFLSEKWHWDKQFIKESFSKWKHDNLLRIDAFSFVFIEHVPNNSTNIYVGDNVVLLEDKTDVTILEVSEYDQIHINRGTDVPAMTQYGDAIYFCSNNMWESDSTIMRKS